MSEAPEVRERLRRLVSREASPPHKFGHQPRLYRLCREIGGTVPHDDLVVFAAAWLHDLGVFAGNRPAEAAALARWDHVSYAVERSREILAGLALPEATIEAVVRVIREHQPHDTPTSIEATIVRDADILEQLGAIAVLRTAAKLGSDTRFIYFADARAALERQLLTLPGMLSLPRSRELAVPRVTALRAFLDSLRDETGPEGQERMVD